MTPHSSRSQGFVLVAVLSVLGVLAGFVMALLLLSRSMTDMAGAEVDAARAEGLLKAGLELAGYQLFDRHLPATEIDGQRIRFDGGTVTLQATGNGGQVDLNSSDPKLLAAVFKAAGGKSMTPEAFAARIADWRDADDERSAQGAERPEYQALRLQWGPANREFFSTDDLRWIAGLSADDRRKIEPFVTVLNPSGKVDLLLAPASLIGALPDMRRGDVQRILALRKVRTTDALRKLTEMAQANETLAAVNMITTVTIRIGVTLSNGYVRSRTYAIGADATSAHVYLVLDTIS